MVENEKENNLHVNYTSDAVFHSKKQQKISKKISIHSKWLQNHIIFKFQYILMKA